jgi:hypothetical protein
MRAPPPAERVRTALLRGRIYGLVACWFQLLHCPFDCGYRYGTRDRFAVAARLTFPVTFTVTFPAPFAAGVSLVTLQRTRLGRNGFRDLFAGRRIFLLQLPHQGRETAFFV